MQVGAIRQISSCPSDGYRRPTENNWSNHHEMYITRFPWTRIQQATKPRTKKRNWVRHSFTSRKVWRAIIKHFSYWPQIMSSSRWTANWRWRTAKFCVRHCITQYTTPTQNHLLRSSITRNCCQEKAPHKATPTLWQCTVSQFFHWKSGKWMNIAAMVRQWRNSVRKVGGPAPRPQQRHKTRKTLRINKETLRTPPHCQGSFPL